MNPLSRLVFELSKLPGVGEKSATRLAYFILNQNQDYAQDLSKAILEAHSKLTHCKSCFNFSELETCEICGDTRRNTSIICIVEKPSDVSALEKSGHYKGVYHVLHGLLSPLDGIGPEQIKMRALFERLKLQEVHEIVFALNSSVEAEATALYLTKLLRPLGIKITQLAQGIPLGGTIEFTDRQTLGRAFDQRTELFS